MRQTAFDRMFRSPVWTSQSTEAASTREGLLGTVPAHEGYDRYYYGICCGQPANEDGTCGDHD